MLNPIVVSDMDGTLATAETWRGVLAWIRDEYPSPAARRFVRARIHSIALARAGLPRGIVTGLLAGPMASGEAKAAAVLAEAAGGEVLAAFGDTVADIPLLRLATRAVAVAPCPGDRAG